MIRFPGNKVRPPPGSASGVVVVVVSGIVVEVVVDMVVGGTFVVVDNDVVTVLPLGDGFRPEPDTPKLMLTPIAAMTIAITETSAAITRRFDEISFASNCFKFS